MNINIINTDIAYKKEKIFMSIRSKEKSGNCWYGFLNVYFCFSMGLSMGLWGLSKRMGAMRRASWAMVRSIPLALCALLVACSGGASGDLRPGAGVSQLERLEVSGSVAVGARIAGAEVSLICGVWEPEYNMERSTVTDAEGWWTISIEDDDYARRCQDDGVRVAAQFYRPDSGEQETLLAGLMTVGAEEETLNIHPFSDVSIRAAMKDELSGLGVDAAPAEAWLRSRPETDEWEQAETNLAVIEQTVGGQVDLLRDEFDVEIDDLLELYEVELEFSEEGVGQLVLQAGDPAAAGGVTELTLMITDEGLQSATDEEAQELREAADDVRGSLPVFEERVEASVAPPMEEPNTTPSPPDVNGFTADTGERLIILNWNNPDSAELVGLEITSEPALPDGSIRVGPDTRSHRLDCLPAGSYNFRIRAVYTAAGNGELRSEGIRLPVSLDRTASRANSRDVAERLPLGAELCAQVGTEAERDWYKVHLEANHEYLITMQKAAGSEVDPMVRLYTGGGDAFMADNNGDNPGVPLSNARLRYRATRTGDHHLQATTGTAESGGESDRDFIGEYRVRVIDITGLVESDIPPASGEGRTKNNPWLHGQYLTRDLSQYELVWSDEFDSEETLRKEWSIATYRPGHHESRNLFKPPLRTPNGAGEWRYISWETMIESGADLRSGSVWKLVDHNGTQALRLAVAYPRYSALCGQPEWNIINCDRPAAERRWRIERRGEIIDIPDGQIPVLTGENRYIVDRNYHNVAGSADGYWSGRLSTEGTFHTRYGYYQVFMRYRHFANRPGFRLVWWMDGQNRGAPPGSEENIIRESVFHGMELDLAEVQSLANNHFEDWFVMHIQRQNHHVRYRVWSRGTKITFDDSRLNNSWIIVGVEWTPDDICVYRNGHKEGCIIADNFGHDPETTQAAKNGRVVTRRPEWFYLHAIAATWGGDAFDSHSAVEDLGGAAFYVDHMRVYKPRDRYGDKEPDNHIIRRPINSEADLRVRAD